MARHPLFPEDHKAEYGLRRILVDEGRKPKGILAMGEQKSLQTDRVVLAPGPADEQEAIRGIFTAFVEQGRSEREIAQDLNARGLITDFGRPWTRGVVQQVLTSEKYLGNNVYHRTSFKLKRKHVNNPPEMWVRAEGVFEGIVPLDLFWRAQGIIQARSHRFSDEDMLAKLRGLVPCAWNSARALARVLGGQPPPLRV